MHTTYGTPLKCPSRNTENNHPISSPPKHPAQGSGKQKLYPGGRKRSWGQSQLAKSIRLKKQKQATKKQRASDVLKGDVREGTSPSNNIECPSGPLAQSARWRLEGIRHFEDGDAPQPRARPSSTPGTVGPTKLTYAPLH
uniref:Uncharacterized protein n=1 Tax=Eutreptiella gymnastica TaxID=73025 RepID=A0A7S4D026_9EUGL